MFASVEGLAEWYGISVEGLMADDPLVERHLKDVETRITAYIAPQYPSCNNQAEAMENAVYYQYDKEYKQGARASEIPEGATSFSMGDFSISFGKRNKQESQYFPSGLSSAARASLLLSGLLYRGVCG